MAEDMVELGMEGFDRVVDKYYDNIHDGCRKGYHGASSHFPMRKGRKGNAPPPKAEPKRSASEPRDDRYGRQQADARLADFSDEDDQGYVSDRPRRRPRRDSPSRENEPRGGAAYAPRRNPYPDELAKNQDHIYPPAPQGNPLNQQLYAAPSQQPYPGPLPEQGNLGRRTNPAYMPQYAAGPAADTRQPQDRLSQEDRRRRNRDSRDSSPRRHSKHGRKTKDHSLSASLAGAVAGGLIGHQAGKGDMFAAAAGAIVGAWGGSIVADKHGQTKQRRKSQDKEWSRQHER